MFMVSLELKGCGVLSEASLNCPLLTSLDASFCRWWFFYYFLRYAACMGTDVSFFFFMTYSQLTDECLSATTASCPLIESLILMSCPSIGLDGLCSLRWLPNLTLLDLSYTFLVNLQPIFESCSQLKVRVTVYFHAHIFTSIWHVTNITLVARRHHTTHVPKKSAAIFS